MKKTFQALEEKLQLFFESPFRTYTLLAIIVIPIVIKISSPFYNEAFFENILVEAHGMLFDILILGVLFAWFAQGGEKQRDIKRYREEIEDYLEWDSDEAKYRIVGNIKRLNRENVSNINLQRAYLVEAKIVGCNLRGANLGGTKLNKAWLFNGDFSYADLGLAELRVAVLIKTNLSGANLSGSDLSGAKLNYANLSNANLSAARLDGVDFSGANLQATNLYAAIYDDQTIWPNDFDPKNTGARYEPIGF